MDVFLSALSQVMTVPVILSTILGVCLGMFVGALPGLTCAMGVAILVPMTFWLEPRSGLGMLFGLYNSTIFAGGIAAVLLNLPGTPASIASTFDGYAITQRGEARLGLWINVVFSVMGGLVGVACMALISFPLARFALRFGPPEFTMVGLFGLSMMVSVSDKAVLKGLIIGFIGLGIGTIGMDAIWSVKRYTFGVVDLLDGVGFIPIMIGMFGIGETLKSLSETKPMSREKARALSAEIDAKLKEMMKSGRKRLTLKEMWDMKVPFSLTMLISVIVGVMPAAGGDLAGIVSWTQCKNISKDKANYGKGSLEGLAMSCAANNCCIGGDMTTMLTLGIPGDAVTAILIGALMMYNYVPGPVLFKDHPDMVQVIIILFVICNLLILALGNITSILFARFVALPKSWIGTAVIAFSLVGSYALNNSTFDMFVCVAAGVMGFFFLKGGFPMGPMVLALILGKMVESNLSRSLLLSKGSYAIFFTRPISVVLLLLTVLVLAGPKIWQYIKTTLENRKAQSQH